MHKKEVSAGFHLKGSLSLGDFFYVYIWKLYINSLSLWYRNNKSMGFYKNTNSGVRSKSNMKILLKTWVVNYSIHPFDDTLLKDVIEIDDDYNVIINFKNVQVRTGFDYWTEYLTSDFSVKKVTFQDIDVVLDHLLKLNEKYNGQYGVL